VFAAAPALGQDGTLLTGESVFRASEYLITIEGLP